MVPCVDTQGPTLVAGTINYRPGGTQGPTQAVGTIDHRSRRPCDLHYRIIRARSPGLSTIKAGEYTQRHVSFLLSFRRAEHGSTRSALALLIARNKARKEELVQSPPGTPLYIHMSTRSNKEIWLLLVEPLDLERVIHKSKRAVDTLQAAIGSIEIQMSIDTVHLTSIDTTHLTSIDTVHPTSIDTAHQPSIDTVHPPSTDTVHLPSDTTCLEA
ncbi:hypothetical protein F2Q70_00002776 [Brassica cretica]|uniref:Uncharacterized protein n=1 Tax=Brassica cretica TaxID=69181 RepID=A0A8S9J678_BRACR|nr:hypothetical protein F2Q70_00002776 [Brassica cretica]